MKTNITMTKKDARDLRKEYLAMAAEVDRLRDQYYQIKRAILMAEDEVIKEMFNKLLVMTQNGIMPTAAQLTAAMGGKMSLHEVVGQLTVAIGEHYNGMGKTRSATHPTTNGIIHSKRATSDYKRVTQRFAEVDESGQLVKDGVVFERVSTKKVYGIGGQGWL